LAGFAHRQHYACEEVWLRRVTVEAQLRGSVAQSPAPSRTRPRWRRDTRAVAVTRRAHERRALQRGIGGRLVEATRQLVQAAKHRREVDTVRNLNLRVSDDQQVNAATLAILNQPRKQVPRLFVHLCRAVEQDDKAIRLGHLTGGDVVVL